MTSLTKQVLIDFWLDREIKHEYKFHAAILVNQGYVEGEIKYDRNNNVGIVSMLRITQKGLNCLMEK